MPANSVTMRAPCHQKPAEMAAASRHSDRYTADSWRGEIEQLRFSTHCSTVRGPAVPSIRSSRPKRQAEPNAGAAGAGQGLGA
jgi:hypothetical protein